MPSVPSHGLSPRGRVIVRSKRFHCFFQDFLKPIRELVDGLSESDLMRAGIMQAGLRFDRNISVTICQRPAG